MKKNLTRVLNSLLVAAAAATWAVPSMTHEANELWPQDEWEKFDVDERAESLPVNVPEWKPADRATGCQPEQWQGFQNVLIVTQGNDRLVLSFDSAWSRIKDSEPANDIWVIGYCP